MNKDAVAALIGWSVACLVTIVFFFIGWDFLFSEPDNTDSGTNMQQEKTIAPDQDPVWGKYSDTELTVYKSLYRDAPVYALKVVNASAELKPYTASEYIKQAGKDDLLRNTMKNLVLLNKVLHNDKDRNKLLSDLMDAYPELKDCHICSGRLMSECSKCSTRKKQNNTTTFRGTGSLMNSFGSSSKCSRCKNSGREFCPACQKTIKQLAKKEIRTIRPYCKEKLEKIEAEQERRREAEKAEKN